jgi:hypothetical protein
MRSRLFALNRCVGVERQGDHSLYVSTACLVILPVSATAITSPSMVASTEVEHCCHRFAERVTTAQGEPRARTYHESALPAERSRVRGHGPSCAFWGITHIRAVGT